MTDIAAGPLRPRRVAGALFCRGWLPGARALPRGPARGPGNGGALSRIIAAFRPRSCPARS